MKKGAKVGKNLSLGFERKRLQKQNAFCQGLKNGRSWRVALLLRDKAIYEGAKSVFFVVGVRFFMLRGILRPGDQRVIRHNKALCRGKARHGGVGQ